MTAFLIWLAVLIVLSAFFSCSETSLFSLSKTDISFLKEQKKSSGIRAEKLLATPRKTLITILIGNMFVNILSSATCEGFLHQSLPKYSILLSLAFMTPLILIFGEIIPKIIAFQLRRKTVPFLSPIIRILYFVLYPVQYAVFKLTDPFIHFFFLLFPRKDQDRQPHRRYNQSEINAAIEIGSNRGLFDEYEKKLIENIVDFHPTTAKYILTPRTRIYSIDINSSLNRIKKKIYNSTYSRIPVYRETKDNIIGVFLQKDLFTNENIFSDKTSFLKQVKEPYFVPEAVKADTLFNLMVTRKTHIHFVVDEYGGLEGLVTLDDVISEIFGTIKDESHQRDLFWKKKDDPSTYVVRAEMPIDDFNEHLSPEITDEESVTVGGFISNQLGQVPAEGDSLTYNKYTFSVVSASEKNSILIEVSSDQSRKKSG